MTKTEELLNLFAQSRLEVPRVSIIACDPEGRTGSVRSVANIFYKGTVKSFAGDTTEDTIDRVNDYLINLLYTIKGG